MLKLTSHHIRVLTLLAIGKTYQEIAFETHTSYRNVRMILYRIKKENNNATIHQIMFQFGRECDTIVSDKNNELSKQCHG